MKKWIIFICIIINSLICITLLFYFNTLRNSISNNSKEIAKEEKNNTNDVDFVVTNYSGFKISPNTVILFETYYNKCNHKEVKEEKASKDIVNFNEEELQEKYKEYTIKQFGVEKVVLQKEINGYCGNHYIIKENNGLIAIYKINSNGTEELFKVTDISIQYLPETDLDNIKDGIEVYGKEKLNKILEDYE